jgi:hypothetical protein
MSPDPGATIRAADGRLQVQVLGQLELLGHFDALLGSRLAETTEILLEERLKVMRERIRSSAGRAAGADQSSADSSSSR